MLQKRANILFEEEMWQMLTALAKAEDISVGELVRRAVVDKYKIKKRKIEAKKAYEKIVKLRTISKKPINYKALIEYGRRY